MLVTPAAEAAARATVQRVAAWPELGGLTGKRVVDVCSGLGRYALAFAEAGAQVTALDFSDARLEALRLRAAARGLTCDALCLDARALPPVAEADIAFVGGNMPGLWILREEDRALFSSLAGYVRPGGFLVLELVTLEQELLRFEPFHFSERDGMVVTEQRRWLEGRRRLGISIAAHSDHRHWEHAYERAVRSSADWEQLLAEAGWQLVHLRDEWPSAETNASVVRTLMLLRRSAS